MGNASSVEADGASQLQMKEELADMHRSLQALSVRSRVPPHLLPDQVFVRGAVVNTQRDIQVMVGPVVGKVEFQRARILLEVNRQATVTAFVSTLDGVTNSMVEIPQHRVSVECDANRPAAFALERLVPGKKYFVTFGGVRRHDVESKWASFRTHSLENGNTLNAVVISGDNFYDVESGEKSLWADVKKHVQDNTQLVLHLGGQVAMQKMFDKAVRLLLLYADGVSSEGVAKADWPAMETRAMDVLRSAYRSQWTLSPDVQFVLANASNLMMWSDADVYPQFSTRDEFVIDHEQPTLRMQVIRTVTRCARRLFHGYQRQLWDEDTAQLNKREAELFAVAEKALESAGQIFTLSKQIPKTAEDLELQKKRHEIEGARRVEKLLRAQEAEKARIEKQLVSYNQLLAPQRGEEFVVQIGRIAILMLDLRSSRLEPGGSQARENELLSTIQWGFIQETLERSEIQLLVIGLEAPVVEDVPLEEKASPGVTETAWSSNKLAQIRLLAQLFEWKLQQPGRQFTILSGANHVRCFARMAIKDTKLRTEAEQYTVGAISATPTAFAIPRRSGSLHDRFEFEHREDVYTDKCFMTLSLNSEQGGQTNTVTTQRVGKDKHDEELAKVLLGPVVGWVDATCAVVLLEVDRDTDIPCIIENPLTRESRRLFQRFYAGQANSFFITHLRAGHFYRISLGRIHKPERFHASFTTTLPSARQFSVLAVCNESRCGSGLTDQEDSDPHLWHAIAERTTDRPFVDVNLTLHLGGQFYPESNDHVHEVLLCAGNTLASSARRFSQEEVEVDSIVDKFREMYRAAWSVSGVRESLAHGAHLILHSENDQLPTNNQDSEDQQNVSVRELLAKFHVMYQNLLLPPSKRLREGETRRQKPLNHCFGAFGLFVLPVGECPERPIHEATWTALREFLQAPTLSSLLVVSSESLVEESPDAIREKAKMQVSYRLKFGFYHEDLLRLLEILFGWERKETATETRKQVVFLSGSCYRSFDSVIREVYATGSVTPETPFPSFPSSASVIQQYVVGPLRASGSFLSRPNVFLKQGTLFGNYTYQHFLVQAWHDELPETAELTETVETEQKKRTDKSKVTPATNQLLHLVLSNEDEQAPDELDPTQPSASRAKCSFVSYDHISFEDTTGNDNGNSVLPRDKRVLCCRIDGEEGTSWQLGTVLPAWLQEVLVQPPTEEEEAQAKERTGYLVGQEPNVQASFQGVPELAKDLVSLSNARHCVAVLTDAFQAFDQLSGGEFTDKFPQAPSHFVVAFTLDQLQSANDPNAQVSRAGALEFDQYNTLLKHSFVNSWLVSQRLERRFGN